MTKFLTVFLLLVVNIYGFTYSITPQEMNEAVNKKFPIEKNFLFLKFLFLHPLIEIDKESNYITFSCDVESSSFILSDGTSPMIRVITSSEIKYSEKKVYLKNIVVEKIQNEYLSEATKKKLTLITELFLNSYFEEKAIYDLENLDTPIKSVSNIITSILVDEGVLKVLF